MAETPRPWYLESARSHALGGWIIGPSGNLIGKFEKVADRDLAVDAVNQVQPCVCLRDTRKTVTTNDGIVFVCETCSHHWFRTYGQINSAANPEPKP